MKFARDYKYRHIPFCSRCAAHTKFTPVQNNRVVGAMTFDNPNSNIDPTLVATRSETKLVCNTCGSEMFKWSEKSNESSGYFEQFLSDDEFKSVSDKQKDDSIALAFLFFFAASVGACVMMVQGPGEINILIHYFLIAICVCIALLMLIVFIDLIKEKFSHRLKTSRGAVIKVGKGVNGETVLFNQATGEIGYK